MTGRGGDENNEGFGVQARQSILMRFLAPANRRQSRDDFVSPSESGTCRKYSVRPLTGSGSGKGKGKGVSDTPKWRASSGSGSGGIQNGNMNGCARGLKKKFELKIVMVGEYDDMAKEARVLNRIVRCHPRKGIACEADPRLADMIFRDTGAEILKTISRPATKEAGRERQRRRGDKI